MVNKKLIIYASFNTFYAELASRSVFLNHIGQLKHLGEIIVGARKFKFSATFGHCILDFFNHMRFCFLHNCFQYSIAIRIVYVSLLPCEYFSCSDFEHTSASSMHGIKLKKQNGRAVHLRIFTEREYERSSGE